MPSPLGEGSGAADGRGAFAFFSVTPRGVSNAGTKAWFCLREDFLEKSILNFTFYILHFTFIMEILRCARVNPRLLRMTGGIARAHQPLPSPLGEGGGAADGRGAFAFFSVTPRGEARGYGQCRDFRELCMTFSARLFACVSLINVLQYR